MSSLPRDENDPRAALPDDGTDGHLHRRALGWTLLLAFLLQLVAWSRIEGYLLADSVEFLDRAEQVLRGEPLDPNTHRSFAFSGLLLPLLGIARLFGSADGPAVVVVVRLFQMALGLLAVVATARVATRLGGRRAGLAAGLLLAVNPVFLQYTIAPLSGTAAMLFTALACGALIERGGFRRGFGCGLLLGLAVLMAFKTILFALFALSLLLLRERWRGRSLLAGTALGFALCLLVQCLLDLAVYGSFGKSLWAYLQANFISMFGSILVHVGDRGVPFARDAGIWLFKQMSFASSDVGYQATGEMTSKTTATWYLAHLHERCLVPAALACFVLGLVRAAARPRWSSSLLVIVLAGSIGVLSVKGAKSFRLFLPLLPILCAVAGVGWAWVVGRAAPPERWRRLVGATVLVVAAGHGVFVLTGTNVRTYGGYWEAAERVEEAAAEEGRGPDDPLRMASAYHWAVKYRTSDRVELVKLPHHLDRWPYLDEEKRAEVLETLGTLDWFVGHLQVLTQDPSILRLVNERFEIDAVLYDRATYELLAPIYVLRARTGDRRARTFFEIYEDEEPGPYQARIQHPTSVDFRRRQEDRTWRQLVFLGWDVDTGLANGEQAWITYHWYAGPLAGHDYRIVDRITDPSGQAWQNNHDPTLGVHPTSTWQEGWIVRESFLVEVYPSARGPDDVPDFGYGPWCRGDLFPARLWLAVVEFDAEDNQIGGLSPHRPSGAAPVHRARTERGTYESEDGRRWSRDGLLEVGGFWMPVADRARLRDDGRPLPPPRFR